MAWITKTEIKSILGIAAATTTWDTQIEALIPKLKAWMVDYLNNPFEVKRVYPVDYYDQRFNHKEIIYLFTNTISFDGTNRQILDSDSNFVNAGFKVNHEIRVQDSQYNDGIYPISTVAAGIITLETTETLTTESTTYYTYLTLVKFPDGLKIPFAKLMDIELHKLTVASINVETKVSGDYPTEILKQLKPWKRPVFI